MLLENCEMRRGQILIFAPTSRDQRGCKNQDLTPSSPPIRLRHPGDNSRGRVPGTWIIARTRRRYAAEHRLELANEVKGRDLDLSCQVLNRQRRVADFPQHVPRPAQPPEPLMSQQHGTNMSPRESSAQVDVRPTMKDHRDP
jgi:hypothetical protein